MSLGIVTDSTCDLPAEIVKHYDIRVVPLHINIGEKRYLDGVDMTRREFYDRLPEFKTAPVTAPPRPDAFREAYLSLAEQGAGQVLSIHLTKSLSTTVDMARRAAQDTPEIPVTVFDSRQISMGTGFLVERAAQAAAQGLGMDKILALLEEQIRRTHAFAALGTLEFIRRSGRMNGFIAGLWRLLNIKPILSMYDGAPSFERVRNNERANQRLADLLEAIRPLERAAFVHTHAPDRVADLLPMVYHLLPPGDTISVEITPVLGAHIGPGAVGIAVVSSATA